MRTGPSIIRGPFDLGVMITVVMWANIAARLYGRRGISRVRSAMSTRRPLVVCSAIIAALASCLGERGPFTNRMAQSGTSYLVRAARQPVRWQPWGRDAFALAVTLDRPVLLYIGSDLCRWCAQSDRDIYMNSEIGAIINSLFVPVRVDRNERPDVAQRYQVAIEHLAGLHGWPLTVFLTADGSAFFGGTYFPADDPITGRGLKQLLPEIARRYHDERPTIDQQAVLLRQLVRASGGETRAALRPALVQRGLAVIRRQLEDAVRSRTTNASVTHIEATALLFSGDSSARAVAGQALELMLDSTAALASEDPPRLVRAALATTLAKAWRVTGDARYRERGRPVLRDLMNDLTDADQRSPRGAVFADQEAYVLEHVLRAAGIFGDSMVARRAIHGLASLLQRAYARTSGVRHVIASAPQDRASGSPATLGLLQDQVQVATACLAAHEITGDTQYLGIARDLAALIDRAYADSVGGYYDVTDATPNSDRTKQVFDDVLPGPNAQAAIVLTQLARVIRDPSAAASYRRRARQTLEAFAGAIQDAGIRSTTFLAAAREILEIR